MRVLVAPDSFKGSITAVEASKAIERGILRAAPSAEAVRLPLSDGGEGFAQTLVDATGGYMAAADVTGPLGRRVKAFYGILGDGKTAVIEMATASGLDLVPAGERDPCVTTTYGTGELIKAALDLGCERIILGIGGSATNDGGAGMAQALGAALLDANGNPIGFGGAELGRLERIGLDGLDARLGRVQVIAACDVDNPLCGPEGASMVYGPQKGASREAARLLDRALAHYAAVIERDLGKQVKDLPGAGAAGGLAAGLVAFAGAELRSGIQMVLEVLRAEEVVPGCHLAFTGEGKVDEQTLHGKAVAGLARITARHGVPLVALTGEYAGYGSRVHDAGVDAVFGIVPGPVTRAEAMARAAELLERAAEQVMRLAWRLTRGERFVTIGM